MLLAMIATVTSIFVLYVFHHSSRTRPPKCVQKIVSLFVKIFFITAAPRNKTKLDLKNESVLVNNRVTSLFKMETSSATPSSAKQDEKPDENEVVNEMLGMTEVLTHLRTITSKLQEDRDDTEVTDEWQLLGVVIDRLCFICTLAVTMGAGISMLATVDSDYD